MPVHKYFEYVFGIFDCGDQGHSYSCIYGIIIPQKSIKSPAHSYIIRKSEGGTIFVRI